MSNAKLTIGFVRRGYSPSGGAENYLQRLARGIVDLGHQAQLFTTNDWPPNEWPFGKIVRLGASSPIAFANEMRDMPRDVDVLMSLERVWRCDVYRAGDGVHSAWLERRAHFESAWQRFARAFKRTHREILRLEEALFARIGASRVIANSKMVKDEIVRLYNYPADKIDIVPNGVPLAAFRFSSALRAKSRAAYGLAPDDVAILFVGSGWRRKGLRFALQAIEECRNPKMHLLVAGRGNARQFQSSRASFLGEVENLPALYAAADIFVLPTIYDPFSNACLEALAAGLPVVTTRANGFSEIIEDKVHGSIVDQADDVAGLRDAILFWSDEARRTAARSTITERASQFDIAVNVQKTVATLLQAAEKRAS
ncbi:MAG: UDP-glucose:(heptosyl)LPS alpha,3-glucosyltransferase [Verrucomicrobiota bacterium]|jgi:UDP-glucose:(heptosyl)LPS alpha-1,3-glucosyltransferase